MASTRAVSSSTEIAGPARPGARRLILLLDGAQRAYAPGLTARGVIVARLATPDGFERPDGTLDDGPAVLVRGVGFGPPGAERRAGQELRADGRRYPIAAEAGPDPAGIERFTSPARSAIATADQTAAALEHISATRAPRRANNRAAEQPAVLAPTIATS